MVALTIRRFCLVAALAAACAVVPAGAAAAKGLPGCAHRASPGGDWPTFGHDSANTRTQSKEKVLSPGDAPLLSPAWTFSTVKAGGEGDITGTPIETRGCVYVATNRGWVFSLNADTGKLVWKAKLPKGGSANGTVGVSTRRCRKVTRRVRVHGRWVKRRRWKRCGAVFVVASRTRAADNCARGEKCIGPYLSAFDQRSGRLVWSTKPLDTQRGADVYGSPVFAGGTLMIGVSGGSAELGDEADRYAFQGSMNFIDVDRGRRVRKTWTIHKPGKSKDKFAGGGIWSTPAIDRKDKVAFVGSANPFRPQAEHKHTNAVLKFDVNRKHKRFGRIIGSYKGLVDEYFPGASSAPCYDVPGNPPPYYPQGIGSCGDLDLDFGAAPNLITGPGGRKLVGAGQKSGVYHIFDARTMKRVRTQLVGPPSSVGGIVGSTAYDGKSVYGPVTAPGYLWSLKASNASMRWAAPVLDGAHWGPPVAVANGVVYTVDLTGYLDAYDARNGVLLAKRPLILGGSRAPSLSWGGVSVARNTIYATVGIGSLQEGYVVAFRQGGVTDVPDDLEGSVGGIGGGGGGGGASVSGGAIVAGPGAVYTTYATPVMTARKGGDLSFVNLDAPQHDVTADKKGPDGKPLFQSELAGIGEVAPIKGLDRVQSGQSYGFFCSLHPGMRGTLIVR